MSASAPSPRGTRQRQAVAEIMGNADGFLSAQEIHAALRDSGVRVGLTTVYRAVQAMQADGELDSLRDPSGETRYRQCGSGHHHHLSCRSCGDTREVLEPDLTAWIGEVAQRHGFTDVHHTIELSGLCATCAARD